MKAIVDKDTCTGCELCAQTCPEVFEMENDGLAHAIVDEVPAEVQQSCRDAAAGCPVEAIRILQE
jgi:ferredoxin